MAQRPEPRYISLILGTSLHVPKGMQCIFPVSMKNNLGKKQAFEILGRTIYTSHDNNQINHDSTLLYIYEADKHRTIHSKLSYNK